MRMFPISGITFSSDSTTRFMPGLRLRSRSGRSARRVRSALSDLVVGLSKTKLPHDTITMMKSRRFHQSRRYVFP